MGRVLVDKIQSGAFLIALLLLMMMGGLWACSEEVYVVPRLYGSLSGKILFLDTRQPVTNALIRLNPSGRSVETDSSGNFKLDSLTVGSYTMQAFLWT